MDCVSYYLQQARQARERAADQRCEPERRAWIELAEIFEERCLLFMALDAERVLNGNGACLLSQE